MEILKTKILEDKKNVVIGYEKDGIVLGLIISVENIIRNFEAIEKLKEVGFEFSK